MGIKLLVADDEENVRKGIVSYISTHSKRIDTILEAEDGRQALDMTILHKPELMLLDVRMPYKTGLEVIKEAGKAGVRPKCIILSGHDEFKYAQQALRLGASDYMLKPCRPMDLLVKLEGLLDGEPVTKPLIEGGPDNRLVQSAIEYMDENYMNPKLSLTMVADNIGISSPYLSSLLAQEIGTGFSEYLNQKRIEHACELLRDTSVKTYEVAFTVGYRDEKYFTKVFKKYKGQSPSHYRKEH